MLLPHIRNLSASRSVTPSSSVDSKSHRSHSQSYQETETGDGSGEIQGLARKILEILDTEAVAIPHTPSNQSVSKMEADDELRRSVRAAFTGKPENR